MEKTRIKEIASALEISPTTASRALSGKGRVSEDTKRRIREYIIANGIEPNIRRRESAIKKTGNILVTVPQEHDFALLPFLMKQFPAYTIIFLYMIIRYYMQRPKRMISAH